MSCTNLSIHIVFTLKYRFSVLTWLVQSIIGQYIRVPRQWKRVGGEELSIQAADVCSQGLRAILPRPSIWDFWGVLRKGGWR